MRAMQEIWRRLRWLAGRDHVEDGLAEEIRFHLPTYAGVAVVLPRRGGGVQLHPGEEGDHRPTRCRRCARSRESTPR
jgi:hypothetical protein